ncbi:MAG TPA: PAS domain S-box protein [Candidatus Omnitrophota bacterium]|nr:PAS domain S-box protein [Candidatus Omnitrophota bacterium]
MSYGNIDFKAFVERLRIGIFCSTPGVHAKFLDVNEAFCKILGYSHQEISRKEVKDIFIHPQEYQFFYQRLKTEKRVNSFEVCLKAKGHRSIWCSLSAMAVLNERGKIIRIDARFEDITARKKVERELIESKELFKTVFDHTAAAITVTDKNERIVAWNPFAETMLEMTKEELFNLPIKDLYPPEEWRRMRSFRIRRRGMLSDIETKIYKRNKAILEVSLSVSVLKDAEGNVTGSIGIIRDITNQKQAERKIKESENKIRVILDNSAVAITLTDDQERIVSWNKFTEHLLGMKRSDLYLRPVKSLYPPEEWKKIRSENIRKLGSKHHFETKVLKKDNQTIDVDLSVNVLRNANDEIIGSVGILQDITEQKKAKEILVQAKIAAESANTTKSLFLANMSHEVRTPMNTILGMLDLTLDTSLNDEQRDNIIVAKEAAKNLLNLLNDILDLSRVEAGKIKLEQIEFHLPNVIKNVCKGMAVLARDKKLEIVSAVDPQVPILLKGDPLRLRQILINLINNAIKFTHAGNITISVEKVSQESNRVILKFAVKDQGIGIPKDRQNKLFEIFSQVDDSTTRKYGGTGLGLAICKRLVEMMSGKIWVESDEGKGSTFFFTPEFEVVDKDPNTFLLEQDAPTVDEKFLEEKLKGLKILLAEDNIVNQRMTVKILEKQGWIVEAVDNGQAVLDKLDQAHFDVVLMDSQMPIMDGFEATKMIRRNEEKTGKHVFIIALTGRAMEEDRQKCFAVGMDGFVAKPIDRKKLLEEIANLFKKGKNNE